MTMEYEQWKKILSAVNEQEDLSADNIIEKIQEELQKEDQVTYQELIDNKFDINYTFTLNSTNTTEVTLSHVAARKGYKNVLDALIAAGANISDKNRKGWTPVLNLAAEHGHLEIVETLLKIKGIKVSERDNDRWTPLNHAASKGHVETVKVLLKAGANVDEKNRNGTGWTALHLAACSAHTEVVTTLLGEGANVNEKNESGWTALHFAAYQDDVETVEALLKAGADRSLKNKSSQTPRDLAKSDKVKNLLKEMKEKQPPLVNTKGVKEGKSTSAIIAKGVFVGSATALLGTAAAVALLATGTVAVELMPIVIAVAAVAVAALAVGGITYMMLKPNTKIDETREEQGITGNERKV